MVVVLVLVYSSKRVIGIYLFEKMKNCCADVGFAAGIRTGARGRYVQHRGRHGGMIVRYMCMHAVAVIPRVCARPQNLSTSVSVQMYNGTLERARDEILHRNKQRANGQKQPELVPESHRLRAARVCKRDRARRRREREGGRVSRQLRERDGGTQTQRRVGRGGWLDDHLAQRRRRGRVRAVERAQAGARLAGPAAVDEGGGRQAPAGAARVEAHAGEERVLHFDESAREAKSGRSTGSSVGRSRCARALARGCRSLKRLDGQHKTEHVRAARPCQCSSVECCVVRIERRCPAAAGFPLRAG